MPEISRFYGIIIRMFFNDHNPPHFHAIYQDYEAIIHIENGVIKGEMPRRALNLIYDWLDMHKDELLNNWKLLQEKGEFNTIEPLT
ncbi:MAG: transcriptional regulator [Bacteroidia bacterium]|nr:MAG: transcriptional regulator [Bacteroidia bacterium]